MGKPATRYMFFTGKGGVGKTSLACATAVEIAEAGQTVLLVSTDPASNLHDVLDSPVDETIQGIKGTTNLFAININPEKSAKPIETESHSRSRALPHKKKLRRFAKTFQAPVRQR